jgi:LysM repeat protein
MNNIKIKLYKKDDIALLRKYKRLIIFLSVICLLLTINLVASFCKKYIFPSTEIIKPLKISKEIERKVIAVEASDSLIDKRTPLIKKSKIIIQPEKPTERYHIVERGQTLYSISKMYNVNIDDIIELNTLNNNIIYLHESIIIKRRIIEK